MIANRFFYDETCKRGPEEVDARQSAEGVRHDRRTQRRAAITSYLVGLDWLCLRRPRSFRSTARLSPGQAAASELGARIREQKVRRVLMPRTGSCLDNPVVRALRCVPEVPYRA